MMFSADRIDDRGLWLVDVNASEDIAALDEHHIPHIVTLLDYQPSERDPPTNVFVHLCRRFLFDGLVDE